MAAATISAALFAPKCRDVPHSSHVLAVKPFISLSTPTAFSISDFYPLVRSNTAASRRRSSAAQDVAVVESQEEVEGGGGEGTEEVRRKLYVENLPWDLSEPEVLEKLFSECGTVKDVQIMKQKNGKSRGFGFVTMDSPEEANAAIEKFDSYELMGRIIRVEFARSFAKSPPPPPPAVSNVEDDGRKIYVSNLAWKARAVHLREFFSGFEPSSAKVVFENSSGRSAGYGFVTFATKAEAETAISELDGKEVLGRPVRLKISQRNDASSQTEPKEIESSSGQLDES